MNDVKRKESLVRIVAESERLLGLLEAAPTSLVPHIADNEKIFIECWERNVVSKVREAHLELKRAVDDELAFKSKTVQKSLYFFLRFPGIYDANLFAQWSNKEKEIDEAFANVFEMAEVLSKA